MKQHLKKYNKLQHKFSGILRDNPVFVLGLAIPIAIMGTTSLKIAVAFCIAAAITFVPVMVFSATVGSKMPINFCMSVNVILAISILSMAMDSIKLISPGILDSLGMYYTLMGINAALLQGSQRAAEHGNPKRAAWEGLKSTLGFCFAILLLALVREFFGSGTVWGRHVTSFFIPSVKLPFMGFIILGLLCALAKLLDKKIKVLLVKLRPPRKLNIKPF